MTETPSAVLIVDDTAANRRLYEVSLRGMSVETVPAGSAEEALARCAEREFALILLDVHLGATSGFDLARQLREATPPVLTPIVFVSAVYTHDADIFKGYQLGAVDYILSPVVPQILRAKVRVFVDLHRLHRQARAQARAVEQAYAELHEAHRDLERFSFSVSHDLRTPLGHILGFGQLLQQRCGPVLDEQGQAWLRQLLDAGRNMTVLIDDMLLLARLSHEELHLADVDVSALAAELAASLAAGQPQRRVRWDIAPGLRARCDARLLRLALSNLLSNALKYSALQPEAVIGLHQVDAVPTFRVSDNGAGFDVVAAGERLFQPFQRFHGQQFEGSGVGLSVVQQVVHKHGGRLWAESAPGQGARFFFTLPVRAEGEGARP
ncbi:sensor histidine kinase [Azohydromonas caseinilytica]|uniref:histidine kinase n=1 Tax=Azohydromonas caseinilytica TaxID=2728836 RepID=A0A848F8N3_9BURK|nr:hybrid sensor histidine kinase/response regulator [Azohydromonas caseinilytica]NML16497.1 response regulator [Azohydromonas caseinilytica]